MSRLMSKRRPSTLKWRLNYADEYLNLDKTERRLNACRRSRVSSARRQNIYFAWTSIYAILGNVEEAKNLVRRVFKLDGSFKADFLDDPAFDSVWESF